MDDTGENLIATWRRYAEARRHLQEMAVHAVPRAKLLDCAHRLGLQVERELSQVAESELAYAFDVAIYGAAPGRSRAIDRIGRQGRLSEEVVLVLAALRASWFSVFRVLDTHPDAGVILEDALLGGEVWVLDEGLTESAAPGAVVATRLARVLGFAITSGVVAVLDETVLDGIQGVIRDAGIDPVALTADPRFVESLWQRALGLRIADGFGAD